MLEAIILAAAFVVIVALVLGVVIGVMAKLFAVDTDPKVEMVADLLPGANCGGCGFAGCNDFAKALAAGDAAPDDCPVCSDGIRADIAKCLGLAAEAKEKQVAVVLCAGDDSVAKKSAPYNGVNDCRSANLIAGGPKDCKYGCLGLGTCVRACPFGAIMLKNGLAVVDPQLCVGCGKCVATCPRGIIVMAPASAKAHVFCNSPEKAPVKKKACSVSCVGCRKCVKAAEDGQMEMDGFLARVNYENPPAKETIEAAKCPTNAYNDAPVVLKESEKEPAQ